MAPSDLPSLLGRLQAPRRARRSTARQERLANHPLLPELFDGAWYLARYPDVLAVGTEPLAHLLSSGLDEGRNPSPYVDLSFVATMVPSLGGDRTALFVDLLDRGLAEGVPTSPFVDLRWYATRHGRPSPDADPLASFRDLITHGREQGLDPSPFVDLEWYRTHYRDITLGGIDPFEYFVSVGLMLNRFPHPLWNEQEYIAGNEYVRFAIGTGKYRSGFEHFCATGHTEVARGDVALPVQISGALDEFAEDRYLTANPDVRDAVVSGSLANGVTHLFADGHRAVAQGSRPLKSPSPVATANSAPGAAAVQGDWLVVLVHFDFDGVVDPHVITAVDAYRAAGADVCAVTVGLNDAALAPLTDRTMMIVQKSTNDDLRDFGGWHLALSALGPGALARYSQVVLANDSVYFPVLDPGPFHDSMRSTEADIFAATDSLSGGRYHLQSYFLALRPRAVRELVPEIGRRVASQAGATKLSLIQRFEVGLTQFALERGMTTETFCSVAGINDVAAALNPPYSRPLSQLAATVTNMTHHFWRHTLALGLPQLKVELLRDNPLHVAIDDWHSIVGGGACTVSMIESHLARVRRTTPEGKR